ncbi:MAG: class I SAM-dependent methyltransferase [Anaerolineae bacterium]
MLAWFWLILFGVALAAALAYWLLVTTEGTYLGVKIVAYLYDLVALKYDRIKSVQYVYEIEFIGAPLLRALDDSTAWQLLDVATGTGRTVAALEGTNYQHGRIYAIDRSSKMLSEAIKRARQYDHRCEFAMQDAMQLGFQDSSFNGVSCLEALEFLPHPKQAVQEMLRVLKPGGVLLLSNRVGLDSWFYPGRLCRRGRLEKYLRQLGLPNIRSSRWQQDYDLVWVAKPVSSKQEWA